MSSVIHGSVTNEELTTLGIERAAILDLSSNLHPLGPDARVIEAMANAEVDRYPDPGSEPLRSAIALHEGLRPNQVLVTSGATDAIHLVLRALLAPDDICALFPPTFGEYEAAARLAGARVRHEQSAPPAFAPNVQLQPAALAVLCNPNNPTGVYLDRDAVEHLVTSLRGTLVLDVAYDAFVEQPWDTEELHRDGLPVLIIHSLTKLHSIPGLRLGYVTGPAGLLSRIATFQHAWSVGAPAIAAGQVALALEDERRAELPLIHQTLGQLRATLEAVGIECAPSRANFLLARVGDAPTFRGRLLREHTIVVRDCTSFGLPEWVRIAVPPASEATRVFEGLQATLDAGAGALG